MHLDGSKISVDLQHMLAFLSTPHSQYTSMQQRSIQQHHTTQPCHVCNIDRLPMGCTYTATTIARLRGVL
jgi:hypothetical protein